MSEGRTSGEAVAGPAPAARLPLVRGESLVLHLFFFLSVLLISLGLMLKPDPAGHSTHTQLGLEPCGYLARTGRPCFLCGATTAFALAAQGRVFSALWAHPLGATLFFLALATALATGHAILRHHSLILRISLWPWGRLVLGLVLLGLFSWIFKLLTFQS